MIGDLSEGIRNFRKEGKLDNDNKFSKIHKPEESVNSSIEDNTEGGNDTKESVTNHGQFVNEGKIILKMPGNVNIIFVIIMRNYQKKVRYLMLNDLFKICWKCQVIYCRTNIFAMGPK